MSAKPLVMFSPHAQVLVRIAADPDLRLRELAAALGMTERNVQNVVRDLQAAGLVEVERRGRRNRYRVNGRKRVGQELGTSLSVRELTRLAGGAVVAGPSPAEPPPKTAASPDDSGPAHHPDKFKEGDAGPERRTDAADDSAGGEQLDWLSSG